MPKTCLGARDTTLRNGMMSDNSANLCAIYRAGRTAIIIIIIQMAGIQVF